MGALQTPSPGLPCTQPRGPAHLKVAASFCCALVAAALLLPLRPAATPTETSLSPCCVCLLPLGAKLRGLCRAPPPAEAAGALACLPRAAAAAALRGAAAGARGGRRAGDRKKGAAEG